MSVNKQRFWFRRTGISYYFVLMLCCARNRFVRSLSVFAETPCKKNTASVCLFVQKSYNQVWHSSWNERRSRPTHLRRFLSKELTANGSDKEKPRISTNPAAITSKQDAYSKLPRLYVGTLPAQPTRLQHIDDLGTSPSGAVCHADAILTLSGDQSHYLTTVLRLGRKKGSTQLRVFDGQTEWLAEVLLADEGRSNQKKSCGAVVQCKEPLRLTHAPAENHSNDTNPTPFRRHPVVSSVWLCSALSKKKDRWRWMIEKTVELGVNGYVFLDTEFGEDSSEKNSFSKMRSYAVEAAEQCERMDLPQFVTFAVPSEHSGAQDDASADSMLHQPFDGKVMQVKLKDFMNLWSRQDKLKVHLLACRERSNSLPVWQALDEIFSRENEQSDSSLSETHADKQTIVAFLIGPEGGWSPSEEEQMNSLEMIYPQNFKNVSLGPTILRAETAAMTAIAAYTLHQDVNK